MFADVDLQHGHIKYDQVIDFLGKCLDMHGVCMTPRGHVLKAVIAVSLFGQPLDLEPLRYTLEQHNITLIEDAAQALGATWGEWPAGSNGIAGALSFNANKIVTAARGGMLVTDSERLATFARHLANQGRDTQQPEEYIHSDFGYNYRMSNLQAAVGVAQMESLDKHLLMKKTIHEIYVAGLKDVPGITVFGEGWDPRASPSHWLTVILVDSDKAGLLAHLRGKGVEGQAVYKPLHLSNASVGWELLGVQNAELLWRHAVSLPSGAGLKPEHVLEVIEGVKEWSVGKSRS
jgi:dTDP-4-amino-4,6-dideoxygalactose transaminase